jgi:hypothetical protein
MADNTGTKDATYNLVSVMYHALQGADLYEQYASDAGSDQDLASFFREVQQQEKQRATAPSNCWPSVSSRAAKLEWAGLSRPERSCGVWPLSK